MSGARDAEQVTLELEDPFPAGCVISRVVVVAELIAPDGVEALSVRTSPGMPPWAAAGLAQAGADKWRDDTAGGWTREPEATP